MASPSDDTNDDGVQLELLCLKGSPYSRRVLWAVNLLNIKYTHSAYETITGEPGLRWRLGRWQPWERATVPVGFVTTGDLQLTLEHGVDIVEWAEETQAQAQVHTGNKPSFRLVPPSQRKRVLEYCNTADDLQDFGRAVFLNATTEDPSLLRVFLGEDPPDAVLKIMSFVSRNFLRCKYRSTLKATIPEIQDKLKALELEVIEKQKQKDGLVYLVGEEVTLADIYISVAVAGKAGHLYDKYKSQYDKGMARHSFDMAESYPVLLQWAKDIRKTHTIPASITEIW